jgi:hypothetical protein
LLMGLNMEAQPSGIIEMGWGKAAAIRTFCRSMAVKGCLVISVAHQLLKQRLVAGGHIFVLYANVEGDFLCM